ncbi:hypothetical protein R8Z50_13385 [Longispora sp. K20-0274]|uniref:hypothetical protein n=1 Tax=Longispora sp. K20-0274 TaxID=3088255 RepID=UPI00399BF4CE
MTPWEEYTGMLRRLDDTRAAGTAVATAAGHRLTRLRAAFTSIDQRVAERADELATAAGDLRYPHPRDPAPRPRDPDPDLGTPDTGGPDPGDLEAALREAAALDDTARRELARATDLAGLPPLLPRAGTRTRNAAVYAGWAAVALVAQWTLILAGPGHGTDLFTIIAWSVCGIPTLALFAGAVTCGFAASPRLRAAGRRGHPTERSLALGGFLCFVALPVTWGAVQLLT